MVLAWVVRAIRALDRRSGIFAPHGSRAYAAVAPRVLRGFYRRVAAEAAAFVGSRPGGEETATVVDLGSGPGDLVRELGRRLPAARVVGVEPFEEMRTLAVAKGGEFVHGAAEAIPLQDRSVDLVLSTLSAHHWPDMPAAFRELDRVIRAGGEAWIYDLRFAAYSREDFARLGLAAGLDPTRLTRTVIPGRIVRPFALIRLTARRPDDVADAPQRRRGDGGRIASKGPPVAVAAASGGAVHRPPAEQIAWGLLGALAAAAFAVWMFLFPGSIAERFAWDVHPRYAQVFIGAGYIFRTAFFLNAAREPDWLRLRWIVWGNLAFTGTLLFATYWHVDEFNWDPLQTPLAHIWIVLYIFEPVTMLYLIPRGVLRAAAPPTGGPLHRLTKGFLVLVAGFLLMNGLLLVINPEFAATRWAWELNPLDARIVAAWLLGWATWCGTMAFAQDWDEIRTAVQLFILNGVALVATAVIYRDEFLPGRGTADGYAGWLLVVTSVAVALFLLQERRRALRPTGDLAPVDG